MHDRLVRLARPVAAALLLGLAAAGKQTPLEAEPPDQRVILGFEEAELGKVDDVSRQEEPGRESWFYLLDRPEGFDFAARFEWPGGTNRAWTWRCRPGEHTQGDLALVATVGRANPQSLVPTYRQTEHLSHFYPGLRGNLEARRVMTTFEWLIKADPSLRNWSGYDLMRVDVRSDAAAVKLWLALEDDVLEPPVMRTFQIPTGRWVTIELDLNEAARARHLRLDRIANFWILGRAPEPTEVRIDNVRIAKRSVPAAHEVIPHEDPPPPVPPQGPHTAGLPAGSQPERTPIGLAEPVVVARGSIVPFGWVTAYDNRYLFVAYTVPGQDGSKPQARAVYTDDGGSSWKELPPPAARNLDHGTARGSAADAIGTGLAISSGPGCSGLGWTGPRQHLTKYTFTGREWKAESPTILDADIRHCGSNASVVRLSGGPYRGRLWASWGQIGREHGMAVHVKFSDDDGRTWVPWGKGALLPGSQAADWSDGTYGYPETVLAPYNDHVACFWRHKRGSGVLWSVYDGSGWSTPGEVSPATLDRMDGAYRATMSAVTKGRSEVFFTATGLTSVMQWDGNAWGNAGVECEDGGLLSVAGDVVTLFTAGVVNRRWQGLDWPRRTVLRYWWRRADGRWQGPQDLTEPFNLHEYRSMAGFSVPPYAPPNYVPLAFSDFDSGVVKLLKVPIQ